MVLSPTRRDFALRGRIGAFAQKAKYDQRELTAAGRAEFLSRFEREVDPQGILPEAERHRRAEYAKKAYFAKMALASSRARARSKSPKNETAASFALAAVVIEGGDRDGGGTPSV